MFFFLLFLVSKEESEFSSYEKSSAVVSSALDHLCTIGISFFKQLILVKLTNTLW